MKKKVTKLSLMKLVDLLLFTLQCPSQALLPSTLIVTRERPLAKGHRLRSQRTAL